MDRRDDEYRRSRDYDRSRRSSYAYSSERRSQSDYDRDSRRTADRSRSQRTSDASRAEDTRAAAGANPTHEHRDFKSRTSLFPQQINEFSKQRRRRLQPSWAFAIRSFEAILAVGFVLGLLFFLRPSVSAVENRELTQFPTLTWDSFVDGSWTAGISTWYADTFPFRESLMTADHSFEALFGVQTGTQFIGGHQQADEIPSDQASGDGQTAVVQDAQDAQGKEILPPEQYQAADIEAEIQGQIMDGLYLKDGACYSAYYFSQEGCDAYISAMNKAAEDLGDAGTIYSILIPNNSGAMLSEADLAAMGGSNQGDGIAYYYSLMPQSIVTVPTMDTLRAHNSEYLYFKTDHHWTAVGAWYIYESFCKQKGIEPVQRASLEEIDFDGFQGTFYNTLLSGGMGDSVDTVQAWYPNGVNDMVFWNEDGSQTEWKVIQDVTTWNSSSKYATFIGGDRPWAEIHNPAITDGSSCIVVKESYGNAFVPWLVNNYQHVYITDFRYGTTNVVDFMKQNGVQDLIIINNITLAGGTSVGNKIESLM